MSSNVESKNRPRNRPPRRGWGSMHHRILDLFPFPAVFGDLVKQVTLLADRVGALRSPNDPRWHEGVRLSEYSAHRRRQCWYRAATFWKALDASLGLRGIRRAHVWALIDAWRTQGARGGRRMGAGTVVNRLVHLRALACFARLEPHRIVPTTREVLRYMELGPRKFYDGRDKSLEGKGVDFWQEVYLEAWDLDQRVAVVFLLSWLMGFRVEEACKWRPELDFREEGALAHVRVERGAKNGKKRTFEVPLDQDLRLAVAMARRLASRGTGCLIPDEAVGEKVFMNRLYGVARRIGFTRRGLGVTPHSLRHSFAQRRYRQERGGSGPGDQVRSTSADLHARHVVSESLGHHRLAITDVYIIRSEPPSAG